MAARYPNLSHTCVPRALALSAALVACASPGDSKPGETERDAAPVMAGDGDMDASALRRDASLGHDAGSARDAGHGRDAGHAPDAGHERDSGANDDAGSGPSATPNIVFLLADDFSMNLVDVMPELKRMMNDGLTFSNYFVSDSLCCPSRTSMFTGKFPHNSGVFTNGGNDGGYGTFNSKGNDKNTFAVALQGHGYVTAMLGKYLNGYKTSDAPPVGWTHWMVADNGYPEFKYTLNQDGTEVPYGNADEDYLTDVVSKLGRGIITNAGKSPFAIEIATFAPHGPYIPARRDKNLFPGAQVPRTPAYGARPSANAPPWLKGVPELSADDITNLDRIYRMRLQSVQAIDLMIKDVRATLEQQGIADRTYIVFTSDNGYHLGDYSLRAGKQTAFDTDIHVPLVIIGPGVPQGQTIDNVVQNVDLCPTFRELAQIEESTAINGKSLVPFLRGKTPNDWRNAALIEHHGPSLDPSDPDMQQPFQATPPSYEAMRLPHELYVEYKGGASEYYDLSKDPYELDNQTKSLSAAKKQTLHKALAALTACKTAQECWAAQHVTE